jgi:hypothetical protein
VALPSPLNQEARSPLSFPDNCEHALLVRDSLAESGSDLGLLTASRASMVRKPVIPGDEL